VSTFQTPSRSHASTGLHAQKQDLDLHALGKSAAAVMVAVVLSTSPVYADEYGRETEADTLFTGETTLVRTFEVFSSLSCIDVLYVLNSSIAFSNRFVPNVVFSVLA
jgi:hypothetical protein